MSKTPAILILIFIVLSAGAQNPLSDTLPASVAVDSKGNLITPPERMQTRISIGTQFTNSSWFGSGLTTFISPGISYRISPRFSLGGGIRISNTTLFNYRPWYEMGPSQTYDANFSRALIYLEGSYRVTDRLTIYGAGFKEFTIHDNSSYFNPYTNSSPHGIYLNADYKISEGVHIQAGFGYTRGYSTYLESPIFDPSPFSRGSFYSSPFQRDPFNTRPIGW